MSALDIYAHGLPFAFIIALVWALADLRVPRDERSRGWPLSRGILAVVWPVYAAVFALGCVLLAIDGLRAWHRRSL